MHPGFEAIILFVSVRPGKLNLIKNYLRATMTETRLNNHGILSVEHEATQNINLSAKARRKKF